MVLSFSNIAWEFQFNFISVVMKINLELKFQIMF